MEENLNELHDKSISFEVWTSYVIFDSFFVDYKH